jgi:hypothetical protein
MEHDVARANSHAVERQTKNGSGVELSCESCAQHFGVHVSAVDERRTENLVANHAEESLRAGQGLENAHDFRVRALVAGICDRLYTAVVCGRREVLRP